MSPFEKLTGRKSVGQTQPPQPTRMYRPGPTGNLQIDTAFRQIIDNQQGLRDAYGPTSLVSVGTGVPVTVPNTDTDDGNGFSVSLQLNRQGTWMLTAAVSLIIANDPSIDFRLALQVNRNTQTSHYGVINSATDGKLMFHQSWQVTSVTGDETCTLVIRKEAAGAGTSTVDPLNSTLTALWQGV